MHDTKEKVAIKEFQAIFNDDSRRGNRQEWRAFFITDTFLNEQYEEHFVNEMYQFLKEQKIVPFHQLPDGLVVELAIVYVVWPQQSDKRLVIDDDSYEKGLYDWVDDNLLGEVLADIWNSQENISSNYEELYQDASFIRRKSYDEYKIMRQVVLEDTWDYKYGNDTMEEYKYTLSMAHWEFLADDEKVNSMDIEDIRMEDDITHACEVVLFDYLLRTYGFPIDVCAYMYKYFELEDMESTDHAEVYTDLKAHILEQYPDMETYYKQNISEVEYASDFCRALKELQEKYGMQGWGKIYNGLYAPGYATEVVEWCEEEEKELNVLLSSPWFQKYKFSPSVVDKLITSEVTVTQAKTLLEIYKERCFEDSRTMRMLHGLFDKLRAYERQEEYLITGEYEYDLGFDSYDFWEYFFSVAFADRSMEMDSYNSPVAGGYVYGDCLTLPAYMHLAYYPSIEWRLRFTNYNKETGRFTEARRESFVIQDDLTVTIEFHYHYVRYFVNDKLVLTPIWDVDTLFKYAGGEKQEKLFLLLLPLVDIENVQAQRVFDKLISCLPQFVRLTPSALFISIMIANDNATDKDVKNLVSRHYIENLKECYRLDIDEDGEQFLYHFNAKYCVWEDVSEGACGTHYRHQYLDKPDIEAWDVESFQLSDLSLPYEVETKVHDFTSFKAKDKSMKLLELFKENNAKSGREDEWFLYDNQVICVFGSKEHMPLRYHLDTGLLLDEEMEKKAYEKYEYLQNKEKDIVKYAKEALKWKGFVKFENRSIPVAIAQGVSDTYYVYGIVYGKGNKANEFNKLFKKMVCLEDMTHVIEYVVENRSEWDIGTIS